MSKRTITGVSQRHKKGCERTGRCRCPWAYSAEVARGSDGSRQVLTRSGYATQREARAAREKAVRDHRAGITGDDRRITVERYVSGWVDRRQEAGAIRSATANMYRDALRRYLGPRIGRVRLAELSDRQVQDAFASIRKDHPNLSPASVQRIYATLRAALRAAVKTGLIPRDPSASVELAKVPRPTVTPWEPADFARFLAHPLVSEHRLYSAFLVAGMAGLRRGELFGLRWSDVDLDRARIVVVQQAVTVRTPKPGGGYTTATAYTAPKTSAGTGRVVDLDSATVRALRTWRKQQAAERLQWGPAYTDTALVWTHEDGRGYDPNNAGSTFRKMITRARFHPTTGAPLAPADEGWENADRLPHVRLHDLRHLQASLLLAAGVPMSTVSKRLGHSTITVTVDTYGRMLDGIGAQAAEAAASLVFGPAERAL